MQEFMAVLFLLILNDKKFNILHQEKETDFHWAPKIRQIKRIRI
jgi:hypothetical protein